MNKNRPIPPVTTCQFLGEKQKQRKEEIGKKVVEEQKEKHKKREREREKESEEVEEERKKGSGVARNPQAL